MVGVWAGEHGCCGRGGGAEEGATASEVIGGKRDVASGRPQCHGAPTDFPPGAKGYPGEGTGWYGWGQGTGRAGGAAGGNSEPRGGRYERAGVRDRRAGVAGVRCVTVGWSGGS